MHFTQEMFEGLGKEIHTKMLAKKKEAYEGMIGAIKREAPVPMPAVLEGVFKQIFETGWDMAVVATLIHVMEALELAAKTSSKRDVGRA